jgi:DNA-binding response OmpR family regulator
MGQTILLVEDDGATRRQLSRALRRDGYAVVEAADGYGARKLGAFCLLEKPFDFDELRATVRRALAAPPSHGAHP